MIKTKILATLLLSLIFSLQTKVYATSSKQYEDLIRSYNKLISRTIELREQGKFLYAYIEPRLKSMPVLKVLTGEDIRFVHTYFKDSYENLQEAQKFVKSLPINNFENTEFRITTSRTTSRYEFSLLDLFLGNNPNTLIYEINPNDQKGIYFLTSLKMSFGIFLGMYDNFLISLSPFYKKGALRRIINRDNLELQGSLDQMVNNFIQGQKGNNLSKLYNFFKITKKVRIPNLYKEDHKSLDHLITSSYSYENFFELRQMQGTITLEHFFNQITDFLIGTTQVALNELSRVFGSIVGNIKVPRSGRMLDLSHSQRQKLIQTFRPLDIFVERSRLHLSNLFIPGYFGHVAIWLGTEKELKTLGLWDRLPEIEERARRIIGYEGPSFRDNIRNGHYIVEALRPGVQMNTFDHFLDINDLAVFRPNNLNFSDKVFALEKAFMQVGKKYDFSFDVETDSTIVCSELVYVAFETFPWPTESTMGRYTINPDHVAQLGINENYFDILMFYKNGQPVTYPRSVLESILEKEKKEFLKSQKSFLLNSEKL